MASGHVNRIERPNTWLHRPMLQNVKKVLANPEPSTHDPRRTWQCTLLLSSMNRYDKGIDLARGRHEAAGISQFCWRCDGVAARGTRPAAGGSTAGRLRL